MTPTYRRRHTWGGYVFALILSVAVIGFGTWLVSAQHTGTPARITVTTCDSNHGRASDRVFAWFFGSCRGSNPTSTGGQFVEFWGAYPDDLGREIDVHVTRGTGVFDEAIVDSWIGPPIVLAVGGLAAAGTLIAIVYRIKRRPEKSPGAFHGGDSTADTPFWPR